MMKRGLWALGLWAALGGFFGGLGEAAAQEPPGLEDLGPPEDPKLEEAEARKLLERLQVMRAWKLSEVLSLDEATGQKLFKALGEHDARIFDTQRKLRGAERGLVGALKADAPEAKVKALMDEVITHKKELDRLKVEQFEKAGALLPVKQRAKLLLFLPRFEKEVRRYLRDLKREEGDEGPKEERRERREEREERGGGRRGGGR
jgi:hypothetical protein